MIIGTIHITFWCLVGNGWEWGNGMIIDSYFGSLPHSLLSTSKIITVIKIPLITWMIISLRIRCDSIACLWLDSSQVGEPTTLTFISSWMGWSSNEPTVMAKLTLINRHRTPITQVIYHEINPIKKNKLLVGPSLYAHPGNSRSVETENRLCVLHVRKDLKRREAGDPREMRTVWEVKLWFPTIIRSLILILWKWKRATSQLSLFDKPWHGWKLNVKIHAMHKLGSSPIGSEGFGQPRKGQGEARLN